MKDYCSVGEAAAIIDRHPETIRRWIKRGQIQGAEYTALGWAIPRETVQALAAVTPTREEQLAINGRNTVAKQSSPRTIASIKRKAATRNRQILIEKGLWKPKNKLHCDDIIRDDELDYLEDLL